MRAIITPRLGLRSGVRRGTSKNFQKRLDLGMKAKRREKREKAEDTVKEEGKRGVTVTGSGRQNEKRDR